MEKETENLVLHSTTGEDAIFNKNNNTFLEIKSFFSFK